MVLKIWHSKLSPKLIVTEKKATDPQKISGNIKAFCETLFKQKTSKPNVKKQEFLKGTLMQI